MMRPFTRRQSGFPMGMNIPSTCPEASSDRFPAHGFHHCSDVSFQDDSPGQTT